VVRSVGVIAIVRASVVSDVGAATTVRDRVVVGSPASGPALEPIVWLTYTWMVSVPVRSALGV
jgi:hypothetical protein